MNKCLICKKPITKGYICKGCKKDTDLWGRKINTKEVISCKLQK